MTQKQILIALAVVALAGGAWYFWKQKQARETQSPDSNPTGGSPVVSNPGVLEDAAGVVNTAGDALRQLGDIFG